MVMQRCGLVVKTCGQDAQVRGSCATRSADHPGLAPDRLQLTFSSTKSATLVSESCGRAFLRSDRASPFFAAEAYLVRRAGPSSRKQAWCSRKSEPNLTPTHLADLIAISMA